MAARRKRFACVRSFTVSDRSLSTSIIVGHQPNYLFDLLSSYAVPSGCTEPIDSNAFILSFARANGTEKSFIYGRPVIRSFLHWASSAGVPTNLFGAAAIDRFREQDRTCRSRKGSPYSVHWIGHLGRFVLYLQAQGRVPATEWMPEHSSRCTDFQANLLSAGLTPQTAQRSVELAGHFIVWARLNAIDPADVDEPVINAFARHQCCCGIRTRSGMLCQSSINSRRVAAGRFMRFLRGEQVVLLDGVFRREREVAKASSTASAVRYEKWLVDDQGLASITVRDYIADLAAWLPKLGEDATLYDAARIRAVATTVLGDHSRGSHPALIRSMRSYIAFRATEGHCSPDLVFSLISRPIYRLGTVPRHLDRATINRVIDSCDPHTLVGIRDRAILLLLAELGLRATEVCGLHLEDIDWERAELRIRGKGGRRAVMPLTQRAGDALFDYLVNCRPPSSRAAVFLRLRRPCVPFSSPGTISAIAHTALARCGIRGIGSAHVFRHSLATQLLRAGHKLQDVATVLRHQSLDTTLIYAKVDEGSLRGIATPWKGGDDD